MTPSAVSAMPATARLADLPPLFIPASAITASTALGNDSNRNRSRTRLPSLSRKGSTRARLMSIVSRKHLNPVSSATVDSHASLRSAGTSTRVPPLSTVIAPKLEATTLYPTIPSRSMSAQQSQEPPLLQTKTKRSIYPNRSTLGPSEISDRPEMAPAMTLGTTILP